MMSIEEIVEKFYAPPEKIGKSQLELMVEEQLKPVLSLLLEVDEEERPAKGSGELDLGSEADEEVVVCSSAIGCGDFASLEEKQTLNEQVSGQDNERNLVAAIKSAVITNGGPINFNVGSLGEYEVADAEKTSGVSPEPKADIKLILSSGEEVGISMKKENFSFLENRMHEEKLRAKLIEVNMEESAREFLIEEMKHTLAVLTKEQEDLILEEKERFVSIVQAADPSYVFPARLIKNGSAHRALSASPEFGKNGRFRSSYLIKNHYLHLSDVLGESYREFLTIVCGGEAKNPFKAKAVLVVDVEPGISDPGKVQDILSRAKTIEETVEGYINDPDINIKFRCRPMTKTRTTYSTSNRSHYNVGKKMYEDSELGVSWTVFAVR